MRYERKSRHRHNTRYGYLSWQIDKQFKDLIGRERESVALDVAKGPLKKLFKRLEYLVEPCYGSLYKKKPRGKDLEFIIKGPLILKILLGNRKIYLDIKSSKQRARAHRERGKTDPRYRTRAMVIRKKDIPKKDKIARSMYSILREEILILAEEIFQQKWFLRWLPKKFTKKLIKRLSS